MKRFNLGSGPHPLHDFIGIDTLDIPGLINWDLSKGLPPQCKDADMFTSCHFFEHLTPPEALKLIKECYKYLRPKGTFRLGVPCFRRLVEHYLAEDWNHWDIYLPHIKQLYPIEEIRTLLDICEDGVYQYSSDKYQTHKSLWDASKAIKILNYIGFREVKEVPYDYTIDPPVELRRRYTIVIEGIK